ncbi:hypothetical protein SAMN05428967_1016 [Phyllobacterium sp. YR620]|uniref:hypothetical protein n=1 Tax=Phyllobacterium sp. YR620 TaxID=1881066 RepID=UPI00088E577D|nr:hypothetical protein [Phyllobacterium sp. YR620]SDP05079.1 hypothetical protein SAMN05428967_1016 [Phyllobacterium sp. YR620]
MTDDHKDGQQFLIARGGPFYDLQLQAKLVRRQDLKPALRAALFVALSWGVPLLLSLLAGTAFGPLAERPFLLDPGPWARFCVAIGLLVLAETQIENNLRQGVRNFFSGPLLPEASRAAASAAVAKALRRRNAPAGDLVSLFLAIVSSFLLYHNMQDQPLAAWAATAGPEGPTPSLAAWWAVAVSNTLFWFLAARAFWRHIIWSMLLADLSKLETRLVATHPDGHAGLGFVGQYPNAYVLFTVAVSCVIAASVTHEVLHGSFTVTAIAQVMGLWLALIFAYFGIPLAGFISLLANFKKRALRAASERGTDFQRQVERKTFGKNLVADDGKAMADDELGDPGKFYDAAKKLSPMLVTRSTLVPVSAAALLPFVAVAITQLPIKELVPVLKRLLLL